MLNIKNGDSTMPFYIYATFRRPDTLTPWWHESDVADANIHRSVTAELSAEVFVDPENSGYSQETISPDGLTRTKVVEYIDAQAYLNHRKTLQQTDPELFVRRAKYLVDTNQTMIVEWNEDGSETRNLLLTVKNTHTSTYRTYVVNPILPGGLSYFPSTSTNTTTNITQT
jgi:hypothetical protein